MTNNLQHSVDADITNLFNQMLENEVLHEANIRSLIITTRAELVSLINDAIRTELNNHLQSTQNLGPTEERLLTEKEASEKLKVSKVTLKKWRDTKQIPFIRIGTRIRYKESQLLKIWGGFNNEWDE